MTKSKGESKKYYTKTAANNDRPKEDNTQEPIIENEEDTLINKLKKQKSPQT